MSVRSTMMGKQIARACNWATKKPLRKVGIAGATSGLLHITGFLTLLSESATDLLANYGAIAIPAAFSLIYVGKMIHDNAKEKSSLTMPEMMSIFDGIEKDHARLTQEVFFAFTTFRNTEGALLDWKQFLHKAEIVKEARESNRVSKKLSDPQALYEACESKLAEYSQKLAEELSNVPSDKPLQRFQAAYHCFINPGQEYRFWQTNLYKTLTEGTVSCESRAKLFLALVNEVYDWNRSDCEWKPAVAQSADHFELVLFSKNTGDIYDPREEGIMLEYHAPVYDTLLFAYGFLVKKGIITRDSLLLRAPDPFPPQLLTIKHKIFNKLESIFKNSSFNYGVSNYDLPYVSPDPFHSIFASFIKLHTASDVSRENSSSVRARSSTSRNFLNLLVSLPLKIFKYSLIYLSSMWQKIPRMIRIRMIINTFMLVFASLLGLYHKCTAETDIAQKQGVTAQDHDEGLGQSLAEEKIKQSLAEEKIKQSLAKLKNVPYYLERSSKEEVANLIFEHVRKIAEKSYSDVEKLQPEEKLSSSECEILLDTLLTKEGTERFQKYSNHPLDYFLAMFEAKSIFGYDSISIGEKVPRYLTKMQETEWRQFHNYSYATHRFYLYPPGIKEIDDLWDALIEHGVINENGKIAHEQLEELDRAKEQLNPSNRIYSGIKRHYIDYLKEFYFPTSSYSYNMMTYFKLKLLTADNIVLENKEENMENARPGINSSPFSRRETLHEIELIYDGEEKTGITLPSWSSPTSSTINLDLNFFIKLLRISKENDMAIDLLSKLSEEDAKVLAKRLDKLLRRNCTTWGCRISWDGTALKTFWFLKSKVRSFMEQNISGTKKDLMLYYLFLFYESIMRAQGMIYENGSLAWKDQGSIPPHVQAYKGLGEKDSILIEAKEAYFRLVGVPR